MWARQVQRKTQCRRLLIDFRDGPLALLLIRGRSWQPRFSCGLTLKAGKTAAPASVTYSSATRTATLDPDADLAAGTVYTATISGAKDAAGNPLAPDTIWKFTAAAPGGDGTPPQTAALH